MKTWLFNLALFILIASCESRVGGMMPTNQGDNSNNYTDTILFPFSDSTYRLNFHFFDTSKNTNQRKNSLVTYYFIRKDTTIRVFQDSFYSMNPSIANIERQD